MHDLFFQRGRLDVVNYRIFVEDLLVRKSDLVIVVNFFLQFRRKMAREFDVTGESNARRVLGVEAEAGWPAIKQAYRAKALEHHPDKHAGLGAAEKEQAEARFRECQEAYDLLKDLHKSRKEE